MTTFVFRHFFEKAAKKQKLREEFMKFGRMLILRKSILFFLALLLQNAICMAQGYCYVNTLDGVNMRDKPDGRKIGALKTNECVEFLEETKEKSRIGIFDMPWIKIRTQSGRVGYVYGAYLSKTLSEAAAFRCNEQLREAESYLGEIGSRLKRIRDWQQDESPFSKAGMTVTFSTLDFETQKKGFFLTALEFDEAGCEDYPRGILPFDVGDNIKKVREVFGEKSAETPAYDSRNNIEMWFGTNVALNVEYSKADGKIRTVTLANMQGR